MTLNTVHTPPLGRAKHRWIVPVVTFAFLAVTVAFLYLIHPRTDSQYLGVDNPNETGTRAVAEVLKKQGVDLLATGDSIQAVHHAGKNGTIFVLNDASDDADIEQLRKSTADLVLIDPSQPLLNELSPAISVTDYDTLHPAVIHTGTQCEFEPALKAKTIELADSWTAMYGATTATSEVDLCFIPGSSHASDGGAVVAATANGTRQITVVGSPAFLQNGLIASEGNAALALNLLGAHTTLAWLDFDLGSISTGADRDEIVFSPPWLAPVTWLAVLGVVVLALVRGRRFGKLVTEPMPVSVPGRETIVGLGRLYRRSRSAAHAAAGLRAGTASRLAHRLGIPRQDHPQTLLDAIVNATNRDQQYVHTLLWGPPPRSDADLQALAQALIELEKELST